MRINGRGQNLPFIAFGDSDLLRVGDQVIAIGNPFGLGQTVTSGIVSGLARTSIGISDFRFFIQTDAAINPGNSGGAQIDMDGRLVGINTSIYSTSGGSQGLGFAIPSNMVRTIVESVTSQKPLIRPWIGSLGPKRSITICCLLGLPPGKGVLITGIYKRGPAETAGLRIGDAVISVDGFPVNEFQALRYRIATRMAGGTADLSLCDRAGSLISPFHWSRHPLTGCKQDMGTKHKSLAGCAHCQPVTRIGRGDWIGQRASGVVVLETGVGSGASRLGISAGDIIRTINDRDVQTVDEVLAFQRPAFKPWSIMLTRAGQEITLKRK